MADYNATDEERIAQLKDWWAENGRFIIAGGALGFMAIFGWRGWQGHVEEQNRLSSALYQQRLGAGADDELQETTEKRLMEEFGATPYAAFSALLRAQEAVEQDDYATAATQLQWVLDNNDSEELRHIARLRLARLLLAQDDGDAAWGLLQDVAYGEFAALYEELRGDILLHLNDVAAAEEAYRQALSTSQAQAAKEVLQMKLDNLGPG